VIGEVLGRYAAVLGISHTAVPVLFLKRAESFIYELPAATGYAKRQVCRFAGRRQEGLEFGKAD
jgi:hypothetical protein